MSSPSLRGLAFDLDRFPDRIASVVAAGDDVVVGRAGPFRMAVVCDPGLARELLTRPTGTGPGRGTRALRLVLRDGLLTSSGDLHRRQRRWIQPAFDPARLRRYAREIVDVARGRSRSWHDGQRVDLATEMSALTLDVIGRTVLGREVAEEAGNVAHVTGELSECFSRLVRPTGMAAARLPTPLRRRLRRCVADLDTVLRRVVDSRRAGDDSGDVISILLAARDAETGEPMPAGLLRDEVLTLLLAGHETTAVALSWAWFELGRTPVARAALDAELATEAAAGAIATGRWERLPVTRAVVAETLRLYPPAYVTGRDAIEDIRLGDVPVRRGTMCLVSPYALGRDPRSWGPDAASWRPGRWLTERGEYDESAPGQPRGAYLPFGAGPRICIGAGLALMEATLALATLASAWRAETDPGFHPGVHPLVTLRPRAGVPATLRAAGGAGLPHSGV